MDQFLLLAALVAVVLLLCLAIPLLLYTIPLRSSVRIIIEEETPRDVITVSWGPFGIRVRQDPGETAVELFANKRVLYTYRLLPTEQEEKSPAAEKEEPAPAPSGSVIPVGIVRKLEKPVRALLSMVWQESRFETLRGRVTIGLGDPVLTGEFYGYYWAGRFLLEALRVHIDVEPVFDRETFACDLELVMKLQHPLRILAAAIRLLFHPAVREIAFAMSAGRPAGAAA
jgi:hypothetical protein